VETETIVSVSYALGFVVKYNQKIN